MGTNKENADSTGVVSFQFKDCSSFNPAFVPIRAIRGRTLSILRRALRHPLAIHCDGALDVGQAAPDGQRDGRPDAEIPEDSGGRLIIIFLQGGQIIDINEDDQNRCRFLLWRSYSAGYSKLLS